MKLWFVSGAAIALCLACNQPPPAPAAPPPAPAPAPAAAAAEPAPEPAKAPPRGESPEAPKAEGTGNVVDIAAGSKDHTTLVAAVKAADLVYVLASPGGVYTVFAPTNAAFDALPPGTVEGLLKPEKKGDLRAILQHHACVPALKLDQLKDGMTQSMADGKSVTFHVKDGKTMVEDATILASIPASNGIVHVVDKVLVPKAN